MKGGLGPVFTRGSWRSKGIGIGGQTIASGDA